MPKLKKGEQLLDVAAGIHLYGSTEQLEENETPEGLDYLGRIASDSKVRIGSTPINEIRRAFAGWTTTVKGITKDIVDAMRMHVAFVLDADDQEKWLREWHAADAEARVQMLKDGHEALQDGDSETTDQS